MEELKRENQIEKLQQLIGKKDVSRRDFFGTLGKIAVLSQVVALGASSFLASCVAFEDKSSPTYGTLKSCTPSFNCTEGAGFGCTANFTCGVSGETPSGDFTCETEFGCGATPGDFTCNNTFDGCAYDDNGTNTYDCNSTSFECNPQTGSFTCQPTGGSAFVWLHEGACNC
jgi:hypothetical protein